MDLNRVKIPKARLRAFYFFIWFIILNLKSSTEKLKK